MIFGDQKIDIIAIDFDGTITTKSAWPEIGDINPRVVRAIKNAQDQGVKFILWTNREDTNTKYPGCLTKALDFCKEHGIVFDAVNENLPIVGEYLDMNTRKITADYYIDDKSPGSIEWFLEEYGTYTRVVELPLFANTTQEEVPLPGINVVAHISTTPYHYIHGNRVIEYQLKTPCSLVGGYFGKSGHLEVIQDADTSRKYAYSGYDLEITARREGVVAIIKFKIIEK